MRVLRGYVFRLYPNKEQEILINKTFGCTRFVYNYYLEKALQKKISYGYIKDLQRLSLEYPWLREVDGSALTSCLFDLDNAFKRFTKHNSAAPRFKTKDRNKSYKTNNFFKTYTNEYSIKINLEKRLITLPKLNEVKISGYNKLKEIPGTIKNAVIRKLANKYYVSILVEEEKTVSDFRPNSIVGLDLGLKTLVVTSHNERLENTIKVNEKRIKGLQKKLSRCQKGSKNREKVKIKIQRAYLKIKNARKHLIHDLTNKLIREHDIIVVEDLAVQQMQQNHSIAKCLTNNPFSEIIRVLKYKALWNNKKLIQINRYYPSSQICNHCGFRNRTLKDLNIREWECPSCHNKLDRDLNASINIMFEGLKEYMMSLA